MGKRFNLNSYKHADFDDFLRVQDVRKGIIRMTGAITDDLANYIITEIDTIYQLRIKKIILRINSPGGEVYSSFAIYDALKSFTNSGGIVEAIVDGLAASAAVCIILQAATTRLSLPSASFLLHEVSSWGFGVERTSDLEDKTKECKRLMEMIATILADRCKKPKSKILELITRKEVWMSAIEAKAYGVIDGILK